MTKEEWIRLYDLLVKEYESFIQDYAATTAGRTFKIRKLAHRNVGFVLRRVEYHIDKAEGSRQLLANYVANKTYGVEEFFQPDCFLNSMRGFLGELQKKLYL